jgi:deoxyribose-phosphate aldolase
MNAQDFDVDIASTIDHAVLSPFATPEAVDLACDEAVQYGFFSVCVYPSAVKQAADRLYQKQPRVCAVIGFPTGATTSATKRYEAQEATELGATELDVVINLGWLKAGNTEAIYREIAAICEETGQTVKAILETAVLTPTEKRLAAEICMDAGASYLKTSTGWLGGATVEDVRLLKSITKGRIGIKAAGGIRTLDLAIALLQAGATRLGTSHGVDLVRQQQGDDQP